MGLIATVRQSLLNLFTDVDQGQSVAADQRPETRRWTFIQLESSLACNIACVTCPWKPQRAKADNHGLMKEEVWQALSPHLSQITSLDFSGGGEPLMQPELARWMSEASRHGCRTGFLTNGMLLGKSELKKILAAEPHWIGFSLDGTDKQMFEGIRAGANFERVTENIRRLARQRKGDKPRIIVQMVMMKENLHQLVDMVRLSSELGVDQINFKQYDVVREGFRRDQALYIDHQDRDSQRALKCLNRAKKLARRLGVEAKSFSFVPDELPICDMDPRSSLFISYDGRVSPCINLAYGGPTELMGQPAEMPSVTFGRLPEDTLLKIWKTNQMARNYRQAFQNRLNAHDNSLRQADLGESSLIKLNQALEEARKAMPPPPPGCATCHYLYDI